MKDVIMAMLVCITLCGWGVWVASLFGVRYEWDTSRRSLWLFVVSVILTTASMAWSIIYGA